MKPQRFSLSKRLHSFKYAINGLQILIKEEHNARIHLLATILAITLSLLLEISNTEWLMLLFCIGIVFIAEAFNTAIENLCDLIIPKKHHMIKKIKDLSAAAVLMAALLSFITGLLLFIPKLWCRVLLPVIPDFVFF